LVIIDNVENEVWARLQQPKQKVAFAEFAQRWQCIDISVKLSGYGGLADAGGLLPMLRGAIGRVLMAGASEESLNQKPCPWSPPCANDVFFGPKPEIKITRHTQAIPKPFVLSAQAQGQDLIVSASIFGFASEWQSEMRSALINAVKERIDWTKLASGIFIPTKTDYDLDTQISSAENLGVVPGRVVLDFLTPVDCKNTDPADNPGSVLSRLANRLALLARWYEIDITQDWKALSDSWRALEMEVESEDMHTIVRNSKRTSSQYRVSGRRISLSLKGDLTLLWPLLVLGEQAHIGRGTSSGLGKYQLKA